MYIHIGNGYILHSESIIGLFDIDISTIERKMRDFLAVMQREGLVVDIAEDLPKSFIVTSDRVYISGISTGILRQRAERMD